MKVVFTLAVGALIGWATSLVDVQGQLALEQHQTQLDQFPLYQTATQTVEEEASSFLFFLP